jgi:hypothetical protein
LKYNSTIENFIDGVDFTCQDPCVWIVYPAGAAGDLLASIINFHYVRTSAMFCGVTDTGRVIFRSTDNKIINLNYIQSITLELDQQFIHSVNKNIGEKNLNYSLLDMVLFSNHAWHDTQVNNILDFFPNAKIIRILPQTDLEQEIINWLAYYKNQNLLLDTPHLKTATPLNQTKISNPRLLDIHFGNLFKSESFEPLYNSIVNHLNLPYKLIRYDFINYWLEQQHSKIKSALQFKKSI